MELQRRPRQLSDQNPPSTCSRHRHVGALQREIDQRPQLGLFEVRDVGKPDTAHDVAAAFQHVARIRQLGAVKEAQRDPLRPEDDREDRIGRPFVGTEADHQAVALVVDELHRGRHARSQPRAHGVCSRGNLRVVLREARSNLRFR
jgi:hypothetical protein